MAKFANEGCECLFISQKYLVVLNELKISGKLFSSLHKDKREEVCPSEKSCVNVNLASVFTQLYGGGVFPSVCYLLIRVHMMFSPFYTKVKAYF